MHLQQKEQCLGGQENVRLHKTEAIHIACADFLTKTLHASKQAQIGNDIVSILQRSEAPSNCIC